MHASLLGQHANQRSLCAHATCPSELPRFSTRVLSLVLPCFSARSPTTHTAAIYHCDNCAAAAGKNTVRIYVAADCAERHLSSRERIIGLSSPLGTIGYLAHSRGAQGAVELCTQRRPVPRERGWRCGVCHRVGHCSSRN
ncbi:PREDICTED: uncharacterized protein LOC106808116 [Priapulus caudatus]|uniref:Uncharacterized protein LOC106808116 n=1 Tax=Priapulus caudatus TaxID=37621 RepID=A0ABM1E1V9_PRICU|nr:PREDICTED: uncharacterized protein LOC106808116 [Priapulus caudatus]